MGKDISWADFFIGMSWGVFLTAFIGFLIYAGMNQ